MKIGLIIAMQKEFDLYFAKNSAFEKQHNDKFIQFDLHDKEIIAGLSGVGKVNAALHTSELINNYKPDIIFNIGVSGGIDNTLNIGDFIVGSQITYHDVWCGEPNDWGQVQGLPKIYESSPDLLKKITDFPIKQGLLCCGDQFITSREKIMEIKKMFPSGLAVDMESAAIAQTCFIYKVPLLCIRQISDVVGKEYKDKQYTRFWQNASQKSYDLCNKILQKL